MATPKVYVICDQNCKHEGMTKEQILTAIMQAVNEGTVGDVDAGFITTIKTINDKALKFFVGEQSAYDALTDEQKTNLFAIITNDTTKSGIDEAIKSLQKAAEANVKSLEDHAKHKYPLIASVEMTEGIGAISEELLATLNNKICFLTFVFSNNNTTYLSGISLIKNGATTNGNIAQHQIQFSLDSGRRVTIKVDEAGNYYTNGTGTLNIYQIGTI